MEEKIKQLIKWLEKQYQISCEYDDCGYSLAMEIVIDKLAEILDDK